MAEELENKGSDSSLGRAFVISIPCSTATIASFFVTEMVYPQDQELLHGVERTFLPSQCLIKGCLPMFEVHFHSQDIIPTSHSPLKKKKNIYPLEARADCNL